MSEGLPKINTASSSMAVGKLAGIHKGTGKKHSPSSPSTPMAMQSCAMQYNQVIYCSIFIYRTSKDPFITPQHPTFIIMIIHVMFI